MRLVSICLAAFMAAPAHAGLEFAFSAANEAFVTSPAALNEAVRDGRILQQMLGINRNPAHREEIPYHCPNLPVAYERNGRLYVGNDQKELGSSPARFTPACNGDVVWMNTSGRLYRNSREIGYAQRYEVAVKTGDVAWTDSYGTLRRNETELGKVNNNEFDIGNYTGIVVWKNWYGDLYRNSEKLGSASYYEMARHTGDVVWKDSYGRVYRNFERLGDIGGKAPQIAHRTGDVGWEDSYGRLYKNADRVSDSFDFWEMRIDGLLIWRDRWGNYHSR